MAGPSTGGPGNLPAICLLDKQGQAGTGIEGKRMKDELESMKGCQVEVICQGITYRGRLLGATEDEVHLQTTMEWLVLPMAEISIVKQVEGSTP